MERNVAFVTGASRGIGKASALALAKAGFDVVVTARTVHEGQTFEYSPTLARSLDRAMPGSIHTTAAAIRALGRRALPIRLDLMDRGSIDAAVEQALGDWGHIDVLLNNGIYQGPGLMDPFVDVDDDLLRRIFEGNVFAQVHLTRKVLAAMLARGRGTVINMTSNAALNDPPGPVGEGGWGFAYGASKGAFHRMAGVLHVELNRRGLRAYNVEPGFVVTESQKILFGEESDLVRHHVGTPAEVPAAVVAWLASDPEAAELSGQTIHAASFCKKRQLLPGWPPPRTS